jgi:hypothetical protein
MKLLFHQLALSLLLLVIADDGVLNGHSRWSRPWIALQLIRDRS